MTHQQNIPLLSPKPFGEYSPEEFRTYVQSLYKEPVRSVPKEFSASLTKKGTLTLRVTRDPKFLEPKEVDAIAESIGWTKQETWLAVIKRKITIRRSNVAGSKTRSNTRQPVRYGPTRPAAK
jgi:hypothetical protein